MDKVGCTERINVKQSILAKYKKQSNYTPALIQRASIYQKSADSSQKRFKDRRMPWAESVRKGLKDW